MDYHGSCHLKLLTQKVQVLKKKAQNRLSGMELSRSPRMAHPHSRAGERLQLSMSRSTGAAFPLGETAQKLSVLPRPW